MQTRFNIGDYVSYASEKYKVTNMYINKDSIVNLCLKHDDGGFVLADEDELSVWNSPGQQVAEHNKLLQEAIDAYKRSILYGDVLYILPSHASMGPPPIEQTRYPKCKHEYVNAGFTSLKLVCKHCNQEKPNV